MIGNDHYDLSPPRTTICCHFTKSPNVEENTAARFTCTSDGAPDPDVSWYRQTNSFGKVQKIGNEGNITSAGKSSTLTIDPVDYEDAGMYLCKANNSVGEGNATGTLVVKCEYGNSTHTKCSMNYVMRTELAENVL